MLQPTSAPASRGTGSATATAWLTLAILSGLNLLNYFDRYVMSAVLTPMQKDLRLDDAGAGWAASAFMLGYFLTAPVFGYLGDRYPRKFLMLAGVVVWSLATAASGWAQNFSVLFAIRIVVGVGEACFVTMGPSWISDLFASTRRNTALTLFYVAIPVGSAIGFTIGGWFADKGDWRHAFIYAGLPGVLLALSLLLLREPPRGEADGLAATVSRHAKARLSEILALLFERRFGLLVLGYTAQTFAIGAFGIWGPAFLNRVHHLPQGQAATLFGEMLAGTGLCATLFGGFVATSLRKRVPAGYVWIMALSLITATPVCFFALTVGNATWSLLGLGLGMFLLFLPTGPVMSELFEIVPVHLRANAVALCTFVIHLFGDLGSPAAVGRVSDLTGSLQQGVLILPAVLLVGAVLWSILICFTRQPVEVAP
ncbi:MAG TPA: MFS transporter [Candidatus Methylacidiphilales bacterium]|nr:MFS transporter [Candidatus Methylacidiphilales bacterium]